MEWTENIIIADGDYVDRVAFDLTVNFERMIGRRIPQADMARWVECIALDGGMRPKDETQRLEASPTNGGMQRLEASPTNGGMQRLEASPTNEGMQRLEASPTKEGMQRLEASPTKGGMQRLEASPTTQVVLVHGAGRQCMENFAPGSYAELHGKAFTGRLGEFVFTCINPEGFTTSDALLTETLELAMKADGVKRIMVVPSEQGLDGVRRGLARGPAPTTIDGGTPKCVTVFTMQPIAGGRFSQEILGYSLMAALGVKGSELKPEL